MTDERRAVLNAIIVGTDPFALDIRRPDVSLHLIWLRHDRLITVDHRGLRPTSRARTPAAA